MVAEREELDGCVKCGGALEHPTTGRPRRYCSSACRRAVEYELRRLQRHLQDEERTERHWRHEAEYSSYGASVEYARRMRGVAVSEIERLEERLRELLGATEGGVGDGFSRSDTDVR